MQVHWASRWDVYLSMNHAVPDKVHWFSIANSTLIVLFLAFMVAMILVRALHRDISKYNRVRIISLSPCQSPCIVISVVVCILSIYIIVAY